MPLVLSEELPKRLLSWYPGHCRALPWREDREPYHIWLSEIMLQQTRVEAVKLYYTRFLSRLPGIAQLANAPEDEVMKLWEGLGYYSRARNLQAAAVKIMEEHGGEFPKTYAEIRALPGIGDYTAGAICSIAYDLPTPAVDGNVLRVLSRLYCLDAPVDLEKTKREAAQALAAIYPGEAGAFTQSLMELGATVCTPNGKPKCEHCPLCDLCAAYAGGVQEAYPIKIGKKPRRIENRTVFVLRCGEYEAVRRRPKRGLLAGLWEYPNVAGTLTEEEALEQAAAWETAPTGLLMQLARTHIFTHVQWNLRCYYISCQAMPEAFLWADRKEMRDSVALPTAFRMFLLE